MVVHFEANGKEYRKSIFFALFYVEDPKSG